YGLKLPDSDLPTETTGNVGFGPLDTFDPDGNEGHTVLRSLWPFLRRASPLADYREIVGCGVMDWRALYLSTLGNSVMSSYLDEGGSRKDDVPSNHLPEAFENIWGRSKLPSDATQEERELFKYRKRSRPVRFLLLTKGEPQREQLGRFISRSMSLETLRFFALRNITTIRNAGVHLELIGRQLDGLLQTWSQERDRVRKEHKGKVSELEQARSWRPYRWFVESVFSSSRRAQGIFDADDDQRVAKLGELIANTERKAIELTAALDSIGEGGAGRILYLIRRANLAIADYRRLIDSLKEDDIEGWTSYRQFVSRGLESSFAFIEDTGARLNAIRQRLQTVTETIQTAALISEAEATQKNTQTLRDVAKSVRKVHHLALSIFIIISLEWVLPAGSRPSDGVSLMIEHGMLWFSELLGSSSGAG
ncbi:MAG: hypothetical protein AAF449_16250, partial [Myxococcota bacterium]